MKTPDAVYGGKVLWSTTCPATGKRCYPSRKAAKRAARQLPRRQGHLNAYPCGDTGHFHTGHLPSFVISGQVGRDVLERETR